MQIGNAIKDYITEFNYLLHQIYLCSKSDDNEITHDYQYNFGNNMRKFLETYLFFKYPTYKLSFHQRIREFFDDDISHNLITRVTNEYSHLGENFDRGIKPIDLDEIRSISQTVLNMIEKKDKDQYLALYDSIKNEK